MRWLPVLTFLSGLCLGAGALLAWILGADIALGFEMVGSRVLECITR